MAGDLAEVPYHHSEVTGNHCAGYALKELRRSVERFVSAKTIPLVEDPNLDPFYLERALEAPRQWDPRPEDESEVDLEDLENEYFMSYMTEETPTISDQHDYTVPTHVSHYQETHSLQKSACPTVSDWTPTTYNHQSQSSCSSIQTDATGVTPDLTPSSSFSSTYSNCEYTGAVKKTNQQQLMHSNSIARGQRSHTAARFYLPAATPDTQSRACTRPNTPIDRSAAAALDEYHNLSSETLTMVPKEPAAAASAASSIRSKPLPSLPPILKNPSPGPVPPKKCHNGGGGSRSQIDASLISPPSLMNPVTMEPHMSPFNHALFIPAHDCPSPVPNPAPVCAPIVRQNTNASTKGRPSTSTSVAHGEQSVWESDSDSGSISGTSQSRRGPIDTLRKVRSRVQLRRIAKSDAKLHAEINNPTNATTITSIGGTTTSGSTKSNNANAHGLGNNGGVSVNVSVNRALPLDAAQPEAAASRALLNNRAAASVTSIPDDVTLSMIAPPPPLKQTLRLVAPSTTSLPRSQSHHSGEKLSGTIDSSTAAAIQAQSRRRQRSNATDEFLPFPKTEPVHTYYCNSHVSPSSETLSSKSPACDQPTVFRRIWGSLRSLDCRNG